MIYKKQTNTYYITVHQNTSTHTEGYETEQKQTVLCTVQYISHTFLHKQTDIKYKHLSIKHFQLKVIFCSEMSDTVNAIFINLLFLPEKLF